MEIRYYPDPVLRERVPPVEEFDDALADLAREMVETMKAADGLGLAGPQVGALLNIVVVSPDMQPGSERVLVNPEITESNGWEVGEEGCLSFPGIYVRIGRFHRVRTRYCDLNGETRELEAEGLLARAVQHELDHLEGRLLVDRMSAVQRMAHRRSLRELKDRYERLASKTRTGSKATR